MPGDEADGQHVFQSRNPLQEASDVLLGQLKAAELTIRKFFPLL